MTHAGEDRRAFLDRPAARVLAAIVLILVAAALGFYHREDLLGGAEVAGTGDPALDACIAERVDHVEGLVADGVIEPSQADSFRARAVEFCRQNSGGGR